MPDFTVDTIFERCVSLKSKVGDKKTAMLFLRYEGCTFCRYDMRILKIEYDRIKNSGGQVIVILQSDPDRLAKEVKRNDFPYDIICDPQQLLYKALDIKAAQSVEELLGGNSMEKIEKLKDSDLEHGEYEGEELQLPASFVIDKNMNVLYARYGKDAADIPDIDELLEILSVICKR